MKKSTKLAQKNAIILVNKYANNKSLSTKIAYQCGISLSQIYNALGPVEYNAWVYKYMPVGPWQCRRFRHLSKIPNLLNEPTLMCIEAEILLNTQNKKTIKAIRKLQITQHISLKELKNLIDKGQTTLSNIRYIKNTIAGLTNKVNTMVNNNQLTKDEKLEIAKSLRLIIKATK